MKDILTLALESDAEPYRLMDERSLMHYGILGQKWGERHYQNPDGTLTDAGRVRYAHKDKRKETMLRRGIAASKNELRDAAKIANPYKKHYDKTVHDYEHEKNRIRLPFNLGEKNTRETDIKNALYRMNEARNLLNSKDNGVRMALSNLKKYDAKYQDFTKEMIQKYGYQNVRDLKRGTFKAAKNYQYENVIDPGLTVTDLPFVGRQIGRRYTEETGRNRKKLKV